MTSRSTSVSLNAGLLGMLVLATAPTIRVAVADPQAPSSHPAGQSPDAASIVRRAAAEGKLVFRLTEPEELEALVGPPTKESTKADGGMETLFQAYPDVQAVFSRMRNRKAPFTLVRLTVHSGAGGQSAHGGEMIDIGEERTIVLRNERDLAKFDSFWGFAGVSLAKLDLREHAKLLATMPFDSRTLWPNADRMPPKFQPARLLDEGRNPGLGTRRLHSRGIDGRGVHLAIIDQPLIPDHREFADRIELYKEVAVSGVPPQMHGPPVASIAAGKTCGVAPRSGLSYFAVPMWKRDNGPYCDAIDEIIEHNAGVQPAKRIRVVSISTGMFPQQARYDRWRKTLRRATESGILVITCAQDSLQYGTLTRKQGGNPDDPDSYRAGKYGVRPGAILVPAGGRTTASHHGPDVYTYWVDAGMSWATPYLAGLAALAYQLDPEIKPEAIIELLRETAVEAEAGLVVNPTGFVEAVRKPAKPSP